MPTNVKSCVMVKTNTLQSRIVMLGVTYGGSHLHSGQAGALPA